MLSSFPFSLIIGTILGFLAGLGIGGGSLLMLWLTIVLHTDHGTARSINLMFFLPAAVFSSWLRLRRGGLPLRQIFPAILSGCILAAVSSYFSSFLNLNLLKKLFGGLLLFTGFRELFYKPKRSV